MNIRRIAGARSTEESVAYTVCGTMYRMSAYYMKKKRNVLIQRIIKSEEGASLSVALLFFLACAIVGSVILAAATSSMGRMKNLSSTEKDKDAVYSTARLVVRRMAGRNLADDEVLPKLLNLQKNESTGVASVGDIASKTQIICNAADNTLTAGAEFSFYRTENGDGTSVDSSTLEGNGGPAISQAGQPDYPNGRLPESPFADMKGNLKDQNLTSQLNLTGYESVRAGEIIHSFWQDYVLKDDGTLGTKNTVNPGISSANTYHWTGDSVPGNHTWMYGYTDAVDTNLNSSSLKKQSYILSVGTGSDTIKVCVDFYMDKGLNIEAQIYPYKGDDKGNQTSSFQKASARCLVKIPANGGELQYTQDTNTEEINPSTDDTGDSVTYKVTITRSVTLSGFGWGDARVYTGSAISAQNPRS